MLACHAHAWAVAHSPESTEGGSETGGIEDGYEETRVCDRTISDRCDGRLIRFGPGRSGLRHDPQGWPRDRPGPPCDSANGCRGAGWKDRSRRPQYSGLRGEDNCRCFWLLRYAWFDRPAHLLLLH